MPAEDPIEKGNKGKKGNQRAGNVANKENRLVMLFVIVMTIDGDVLAIVMRTDDDDGNDDIDDGLNTWLAPLDAASRMFATSLFCEWETDFNSNCVCCRFILYWFPTWVGRFSAFVRDFLVSG